MQAEARNRFSTKGYTATKLALVVIPITYTIVADWGGRTSSRSEFFPVFNWSLFTYVNSYPLLAELHVVSIGDKRFEKPVNYFDLDSYFQEARERSSTVSKTVVRLHAAIRMNDAAEVARLRRVVETRYLGGHGSVEYEIHSVRFSAIERWKSKDYVGDQTVLARFKVGGPP